MVGKEDLFVGIDPHKQRWHISIGTWDTEVFTAGIPGTWEALQRVSVLLNLVLPDGQGMQTLKSILEAAPNVPVVVLTGLADEEFEAAAIRI
jgi:DNA-binding response OmpR family regulator